MLLSVSLKSLLRRRVRTGLALAGIAISAALLLDMTMLASGLSGSFGELIGAGGYALRVTPAGTLPFDSEAGIRDADAVASRIAGIDGVRSVAPVLGAQLYLVNDDADGQETLFASGVDPSAEFLYELLEGGAPGAGEVVVSQPLAEAQGVEVGDRLTLAADLDVSLGRPRNPAAFTVAGTADFIYDAADQRSVAMPLAELRGMVDRADEVSLFGVAVHPEADEATVARRIEAAVPGVSAFSTAELTAELNEQLLYFRQLATILGSVSLVVTALLIATIVIIGVRERFGEIATLRAIGVRRGRILAGVVAEGLLLAAAGCLLGLPLGYWMAGYLDGILLTFPGVPMRVSFFVFEPARVVASLGVVIGVGALAGLFPGLQAVGAPLSRALREEAA